VDPRTPTLGDLLRRVTDQPADHDARVFAARTALSLAFRQGDPHLADVAESLLVDAPRRLPAPIRAELERLAAQAHATRRAVAMAHHHAHAAPLGLALCLTGDPEALAAEVEQRLVDGQRQLARAILEVSLTRHPRDPRLLALRERVCDPWPDEDSEELTDHP
jgi:hypothetical protein